MVFSLAYLFSKILLISDYWDENLGYRNPTVYLSSDTKENRDDAWMKHLKSILESVKMDLERSRLPDRLWNRDGNFPAIDSIPDKVPRTSIAVVGKTGAGNHLCSMHFSMLISSPEAALSLVPPSQPK